MSATILIAASEYLPALKAHDDFGDAMTFADTDVLPALEAITRERPDVVALERAFATTPRGGALVNRIKADPALTACQIRIVTHVPSAPAAAEPSEPEVVVIPVAVETSDPTEEPGHDEAVVALDQHGTRRAPRFAMREGHEITIDGNVAAMLDLSIGGAQVLSPIVLKPNQRVRLGLPGQGAPLRLRAAVAWARFEMPSGVARYRAGLQFIGADAVTIERYIVANRDSESAVIDIQ